MSQLSLFERLTNSVHKVRPPWWIAMLVFFVLMLLWSRAVSWYEQSLLAEHISQTTTEVGLRGNTLSLVVNRRVSLLTGLYAFVQTDAGNPGFESRFNGFAEEIFFSTSGIRHIALAPDGVMRYVYPLSGNGAVLGYEPLKDHHSEIREDLERMLASKEMVISGPTNLVQGGRGLIARQPVYLEDQFWGIIDIAIDFNALLEWADFDETDQSLDFALLDTRGRLIYGNGDIINQSPVIQPVELMDGAWQLVGIPKGGWLSAIRTPLRFFQLIGIALVALITLSVFLIADRQSRLKDAVQQRTQEISLVNQQLQEYILERLHIEKALRNSEEQLSNILRIAPDAIISCTDQGVIQLFNNAAESILGYQAAEVLGEHISHVLPKKITHQILKIQPKDPASGSDQLPNTNSMTFTCFRKDGASFPAEASIADYQYGLDSGFIVIVRDITERLHAEEAIMISESRFRGLYEQSLFAIQLFAPDGNMIGYNQAFYNQFAKIFPKIEGYNILDDPINAALGLFPAIRRAIGGEIVAIPPTQLTAEHFPALAGQPTRWIKFIMNPITDEMGVVLELAVIFEDISEQMQAEFMLKERELQYRSIFESVSDGLFINTLDGELVDFNPAAAHMHGYTIEEFRGIQPPQFIQSDSFKIFEDYMQRVNIGTSFRGRAIDIRKDGTHFHVEVTGSRFIYQGQPHSLAVVRDVTEQVESYKLLEERVRERTREIYTLLEVSRNVASTLELRTLLTLILDQLKDVLDYHSAEIFIIDGREAVLLDQRGSEHLLSEQRFNLAPGSAMHDLLKSTEPIIVPSPDGFELMNEMEAGLSQVLPSVSNQSARAKSYLMIPLIAKTGPIGFLKLTHDQSGYYRRSQADLAQAFASQVAVAIENARLYEQAQSLASIQERQKLARELHDSVSQALYGIALGARTARTLLDRQMLDHGVRKAMEEPLDYVLELADAGLAEMRALIFELRPESLETEGLVAAMRKQAAALQARYQMIVHTDFIAEPDIPLASKEALFRIAQEATHNTVKHAQATQISLSLQVDGDQLVLEIRDNGKGFNTSAAFPGHLGLRSMQERMERVRGSLSITSILAEGTKITARIPYTKADRN